MLTPGMLVLADRFDPGWQAHIDGKLSAVFPVNHVLRGVMLQPGKHTVQFRYSPASYRYGMIAALVGAVLLLCSFLMNTLRQMPR